MSGLDVDKAKLAAYALGGLFAGMGGLFLGFQTLTGDAQVAGDYTLKSIAAVVIGGTSLVGGSGGAVGSIFGAYMLRTINGVLFFAGVSPLTQPLYEGLVLLAAIGIGGARIVNVKNRLELMATQEVSRGEPTRRLLAGMDNSVLVSLGAIVLIVAIGSVFLPDFLSVKYLIQQLRIASFLGIIATGAMVVILLGHIDLSIPWTMTVAAMVATTITGFGGPWVDLAIPAGLLVGVLVGLINGVGVGVIRLPSMILTLAVNAVLLGLTVVYTGGFAPQTKASPLMRWLGRESSVLGIPNVLWVWLALGAFVVLAAAANRIGARRLRRRQSRDRELSVGHPDRASDLHGIRLCRLRQRARRHPARRPLRSILSGHGQRLPVARHRRRGDRWHAYTRRARHLSRHGRRRPRHHASVERARGDADAGGEPTDHLRRGDHRDAAAYCCEAKEVTP